MKSRSAGARTAARLERSDKPAGEEITAARPGDAALGPATPARQPQCRPTPEPVRETTARRRTCTPILKKQGAAKPDEDSFPLQQFRIRAAWDRRCPNRAAGPLSPQLLQRRSHRLRSGMTDTDRACAVRRAAGAISFRATDGRHHPAHARWGYGRVQSPGPERSAPPPPICSPCLEANLHPDSRLPSARRALRRQNAAGRAHAVAMNCTADVASARASRWRGSTRRRHRTTTGTTERPAPSNSFGLFNPRLIMPSSCLANTSVGRSGAAADALRRADIAQRLAGKPALVIH